MRSGSQWLCSRCHKFFSNESKVLSHFNNRRSHCYRFPGVVALGPSMCHKVGLRHSKGTHENAPPPQWFQIHKNMIKPTSTICLWTIAQACTNWGAVWWWRMCMRAHQRYSREANHSSIILMKTCMHHYGLKICFIHSSPRSNIVWVHFCYAQGCRCHQLTSSSDWHWYYYLFYCECGWTDIA